MTRGGLLCGDSVGLGERLRSVLLEYEVLTWSRKTTIAVEYCYRRSREHPRPHIFWINGNSDQTFKDSYLEIGQRAGLRNDDDDNNTRLQRVKLWLESLASGNWIMVIDNLDDLDLMIMRYIPSRRGAILFTTRDARIIGHPGYLSSHSGVGIGEMSDQEAFDTFSRHLGAGGAAVDHNISKLLLHRFENLPLAIAQAAAYIRETGTSLGEYLELYRECEQNQQDLLSVALPNAIESESPTTRAVMMTWKITMDKIQRENPPSFKLLQLMSFLDPAKIPEDLIKSASFLYNKSTVHFAKALASLLSYALLSRLESSNYRLHRLVGFCVREQIDLEGPVSEGEELLKSAVGLVHDSFPTTPMDDYSKCTQYLPHAMATLEHAGRRSLKFGLRWELQDFVGRVIIAKADYASATAMEWHQRALDGREKTLGKDYPETFDAVNNIGTVFDRQGENGKALEWFQRALDGCQKTLGKDHPFTLSTVHNMGLVFHRQGKYGKALEWYQRALDGREKTLGKDRPDTLNTVHNMGLVFHRLGEYGKALEWYQRALDGREKTLGKDHPDTLDTVNNMATIFTDRGEYGKALEWYQRALDGREKTLGKDHHDTLSTVDNMGSAFDRQGEFDKGVD
jgi:tetratricopeptide (TPR) repeat protein